MLEVCGRRLESETQILPEVREFVTRHTAYNKFGGIGFFNKEDSTRKGGTVQVRTSERSPNEARQLLQINADLA